ncbi:MAG: NfeD family protein [Oscillatoriophycideae cyanobacterium NC_groundwater_1537_Pr4_S-0.65um_50_18]|nr:NfeD family protein [Oscillatoriophycideae cyanobacterium NC_groundwater_1537_Pr4_S-0.65um_50_18]
MFLTSKFPKTVQMFSIPALGKVDQTIAAATGRGRIKFQGSLWGAEIWQSSGRSATSRTLLPSEQVWVIGRIGLTLLVQPYVSAPSESLDRSEAIASH